MRKPASVRFVLAVVTSATMSLGLVGATAGTSVAGGSPASPVRSVTAPAVRHTHQAPEGAATAVVVRSWGQCSGSSLVWDDLNANWSSYGSIPIAIDYDDPALCGTGPITLAALQANGAHTVILSDLAGGTQQLSPAEVNALKQYAAQGHNVLGTYVTFAYSSIDNTALLPLFGLAAGQSYTGGLNQITPSYTVKSLQANLFRNVGNPYVSLGYPYAQTPSDGVWSPNELSTGKLVARNADGQAAVIVRRAPAYYAIFIANMPEYQGGTADKQFIYNAIIFPATG